MEATYTDRSAGQMTQHQAAELDIIVAAYGTPAYIGADSNFIEFQPETVKDRSGKDVTVVTCADWVGFRYEPFVSIVK